MENLWKSIDLPCAKQEAASRLKSGFPLFVTLWAFEKASMLEAEASRKGFLSFPFQSSRQKPIDRLREGRQGSKQHRKGKAIFLGFCESSGSFHTFPILREDHQERKADKRRKLLRKASQDVKKRKKGSQIAKSLFLLPLRPKERKGKRKRRRQSWHFAGKGL